MDNQKKVLVVTQKQPTVKDAVKYAVATVVVLIGTGLAHAGELDAVGAQAGDEITSVKAIMLTIFSSAIVILSIIAGWKYLKRSVNAA